MNDLGGPDFEGVGYSFGVERLVLARKNVEELKNSLDYFMIVLDKTKGAKWGRKRSDGVEYVIDKRHPNGTTLHE